MEEKQKPDLMHGIFAGIIRSRFLILIFFIAAGIYCALSVGKVRVNYYLTQDSRSVESFWPEFAPAQGENLLSGSSASNEGKDREDL